MNLSKQEYNNAIHALTNNHIVEDGQYTREYSGKLSSIGPDTVYMGLIPAIALYESKPGKKEGKIKANVCKAVLELMPGKTAEDELLYQYIQRNYRNNPALTMHHFDKAVLVLKMALRLFKEKI